MLGSAPTFPNDVNWDEFDLVVSANGSGGRAFQMGRVPDLTFMSSLLVSNRCNEEDWKQIRDVIGEGRASAGLVVIRNGAHFEKPSLYKRFGYSPAQVSVVKLGRMRRILIRVTKSFLGGVAPDGLPSMGILTTALLAHFGAKSIVLSGFSLTSSVTAIGADHYYDGAPIGTELKPRNHSAADLFVLSALAIRGFPITATEPDLQIALMSWGPDGQHWFKRNFATTLFWSPMSLW